MSPSAIFLEEKVSSPLPAASAVLEPSRGPSTSLREHLALAVLVALLIYATIRSVCHALVRPFWFDEVCTALITRQENLSKLWHALKEGADSAPMFFYLVERVFTRFSQNVNLSYRIAPIMGFAMTIACLFVAIRKRKGPIIAAVCSVLPLFSVLFDVFAVEARGYSMVAACIAFALVCYDRVSSKIWVFLLALSLMAAESFHYFAVFAFIPFLAAEATRTLLVHKARRLVWLALCSGFVPFVLFWPVLAAEHRYYGEHMWWPKATLSAALDSYSFFFPSFDEGWGPRLAALAVVALLFAILRIVRDRILFETSAADLIPEFVFAIVLVCLPLVGFAVAALTHNGVVPKYFISAILGFPLALAAALPKPGRWAFLFASGTAALVLYLLAVQEFQFWRGYTAEFVSPTEYPEALVQAGGHDDLPVVVSDSHDFMPLQFYASPEWRRRFVILLDPEQEVVYTGNDSTDKNLIIFKRYTDLPIYDFHSFLIEHPSFLVYSGGGGLDRDWWPSRLKHDGFNMKNVAIPTMVGRHDYFHRVILVTKQP